MIKILHIHTALSFIAQSNKQFDSADFDNRVILLGEQQPERLSSEIEFYVSSKKGLNAIIELCNAADIVVLYALDYEKSYIANRVNQKTKLLWRFFGTELYSKMPEQMYSAMSSEILKQENTPLKQMVRGAKKIMRGNAQQEEEFAKAMRRVDYFLGLADDEYDFLKKHWPDLPAFMQIPLAHIGAMEVVEHKQYNRVLLGNSRVAYNNHIDVIRLIAAQKQAKNYRFELLFNYGYAPLYADRVKAEAQQLQNINIIEEMMPFEEYQSLFNKMDAFVFNGYRQMAMRAVFESLRNGVKVYLNKKNVILNWLQKEGFLVFSIDDFSYDLKADNISLNPNQITHNSQAFDQLRESFSLSKFWEQLREIA